MARTTFDKDQEDADEDTPPQDGEREIVEIDEAALDRAQRDPRKRAFADAAVAYWRDAEKR